MSYRMQTIVATVLTTLFLADTGWQVYRLTQNQPTTFYGMVLLVPILWLLKGMSAARGASASAPGNDVTAPR
jgi:hypothetical protein